MTEDTDTIEKLKTSKAVEIKKLNLKFHIIDVFDDKFKTGEQVDYDKLALHLKSLEPTTIIIGWCHSKETKASSLEV